MLWEHGAGQGMLWEQGMLWDHGAGAGDAMGAGDALAWAHSGTEGAGAPWMPWVWQGTLQGVGCCGSVLLQGTFLRAWADELWPCPCQSRKWI